MLRFLLATGVILAVMIGWLYVEELYRRFRGANPHLGPFRTDGAGCGGGCCSCANTSCTTNKPVESRRQPAPPDAAQRSHCDA